MSPPRPLPSLAVAAALVLPAAAGSGEGHGSVSGRVSVAAAPATAPEPDAEIRSCEDTRREPPMRTGGDGSLAEAVISLAGAVPRAPAARPPSPPVLDHRGCRFAPRVLALAAGEVLELVNSDPVPHLVRATGADETTLFRVELPVQGQRVLQRARRAGRFTLACDAGHPWTSGTLVIVPAPPVAVTGADGRFRLDGVPAGSRRLIAFHPALGERTADVTVEPGAVAEVAIVYPLP